MTALVRRLGTIAVLIGSLLLSTATAAQAHAVLENTTPATGSVLHHEPAEVTLTFGETVGVSADDIQVFDDQLHRVDVNGAGHITGHGNTVGVHLKSGLPHGTYTVTWRVISADSHPVSGGFTFSIGAPSTVAGKVGGLGGGSQLVGLLLGGSRLLGYLGLVAGPGVLVFLILLWPAGRGDRRARGIVTGGLAAGVVAAIGLFVFEGPYAQGLPLSKTFAGGNLSVVASSHYGKVVLTRLGLLLVLALIIRPMLRGSRLATGFGAVVGVGLAVTWAIAGHGGTGSYVWLAGTTETVHVMAVTIWLGGLVSLVALLPRATHAVAFDVLPRFSALALACIAAIIATGTYLELRETDVSWSALTTTTYGKLLMAKIAGVVVILWLGVIAQWLLAAGARRALAGADDPDNVAFFTAVRRRLRRSVSAEIVVGITVLVLTSILVNTVPAKDAVASTTDTTLKGGGLRVSVAVTATPGGPGTIDITATTASGAPQHLVGVTGSLSLPARDIADLPVTFATPDGNHVAAATDFPLGGRWKLSLDVQTSAIDATTFATSFVVP